MVPTAIVVTQTTPLTLQLAHQAVYEMPGSGSGEELLAWAGLDADHVAAAARRLLKRD